VAAVATIVVLSRRIGGLEGRGIEATALRVVVVSAVAGTAAWLCSHEIGFSTTAAAIGSVVTGGVAAIAVTVGGFGLLHLEEFDELAALVRRRRSRSRAAGTDARRGDS
jgi:peptidoglycan biosynthesis protein MviN/MurJ (putative lipid II flippase)